MRGSLKQRYKGSWSIVLDLGYRTDPETGQRKRQQKWITVRGTKREAQTRLNDMLAALNKGELVEPTKITVAEWLHKWWAESIRPTKRRATVVGYRRIIERHLIPCEVAPGTTFGSIPLQALRPGHLKTYYASKPKLSRSTLAVHHSIMFSALRVAIEEEGLLTRNAAALVNGKPRPQRSHENILADCWTADEARAFLVAAKAAGAQPAAFYALALDTGMRKGELCGLKWSDADLDGATVTVLRTLLQPGPSPVFGPTKTGLPRTIDLGSETVRLLRAHKRHQAELKMANRSVYRDHGLLFAKEWSDVTRQHDVLGQPLQANNLGQREYARLIKVAGVRRIKFHGLRHTAATLMFQQGVPAKVVQERLGHKRIETTLNIYAHCLPAMGQDAAAKLGALLHG